MAAYNIRQKDLLQVKKAIAEAARNGLGVVAIKTIRGEIETGEEIVNAAASLKWVLQDSNVHATIPAFSNIEELAVDLSVMENLELTETENRYLKRINSTSGLYCQGCGRCLQQCYAGLPIPDLMRAYMYTYGYRQPALAQSLISTLALTDKGCADCSLCTVTCTNGCNISEKISDLIHNEELAFSSPKG
jgi:predicted aldo/keto reductase-like oxidoreductase